MVQKYFKNLKVIFISVMCIGFCVMLSLNMLSALVQDDYAYLFSFSNGERITNLSQIIDSMQIHYHTMNGRIYAHSLAQMFLSMPLWIFDILNSLLYVLVGFIIYKLIVTKKEYNAMLLTIIYVLMYLIIPDLGQTVLWTTGACTYFWTLAAVLLFLVPYYYYWVCDKNLSKVLLIPFFVGAFIAGNGNENTSGGAILCAILIVGHIIYKKRAVKSWMLVGICLATTGFLCMILAPANALRESHFNESYSLGVKYMNRVVTATNMYLGQEIVVIVVLSLIVIGFVVKLDKNVLIRANLFFLISLACNYAMVLSPFYPARAFIGGAVFRIIAGLIIVYHLKDKKIVLVKAVLVTYIGIQFISNFIIDFDCIFTTHYWHVVREKGIEAQKEAGNYDIESFEITTLNTSCIYGIGGLSSSTDSGVNRCIAKYYELNTFRAIETWKK